MMQGAFCIAAPKSGSGKTMAACGLIKALQDRGLLVQPFKTGPDYIDPLFHDRVLMEDLTPDIEKEESLKYSLHKCENLDTFFLEADAVRELYSRCSEGADISVIEGVMGLYDGLSSPKPTGIDRINGSTYELAAVLDVPVILVVDAKGASMSLIAEIRGFMHYDRAELIKGVIFNRCSGRSYELLKKAVDEELGIKPLGFIPVLTDIHIESRYLGLMLPKEVVDIKSQIKLLAGQIEESVDIDGLIEISGSAG